jgi:hypothetical protein
LFQNAAVDLISVHDDAIPRYLAPLQVGQAGIHVHQRRFHLGGSCFVEPMAMDDVGNLEPGCLYLVNAPELG